MTFAIRIGRKKTTVSLRTQICSLWYIMREINPKNDRNFNAIHSEVKLFVDNCVEKWKGKDGKGLSEHIQECMVYDILDTQSQIRYKRIFSEIQVNDSV